MQNHFISLVLALLLSLAIYPLKYFSNSSINFLPVQFLVYVYILLYFFKINVFRKLPVLLLIFLLYFVCIAIYNISTPLSLITNPIIITFITIILVIYANGLRKKHEKYLDSMLYIFFILFILFSIYLNIEHMLFFGGFSKRSSGFSSGTLYATLSVITIVYFIDKLKYKDINKLSFIVYSLIPFWSLILTQSRGALLTLIIVLLLKNASNIKMLIRFIAVAAFIMIISKPFWSEIANSNFAKRFDPSSYSSTEQFTSNRLQTQEFILNDIQNEPEITILFGKGLNELKFLVTNKHLEFPHFDLLYVLYDGGLFSVLFYLFFVGMFIITSKTYYYPVIYLVSGMHTNMIVSPAYIILLYLLAMNFYYKEQEQKNKKAF